MRKLYFLILLAFSFSCQRENTIVPSPQAANPASLTTTVAPDKPPVVVILGSSTAFGSGASSYKAAWAGLFSTYLKSGKIINLAKGGYTTYHMLPTQTITPPNRPQEDTLRNITAALKLKPTVLILSMTTNDVYFGFSVEEVMNNVEKVRQLAFANGVKRVLITTSMPRKLNAASTEAWIKQRTLTIDKYAADAVNFFDPLADKDKLFKAELTPDGIHPNDDGHLLLFQEVVQTYTGSKSKVVLPR